MMLELTVTVAGRSYSVDASKGTTIGRADDCGIVIKDSFVSHHHALLHMSTQGWVLEDTGSANGLIINGQRMASVLLPVGVTVVNFGQRTAVTFTVRQVASQPPARPSVQPTPASRAANPPASNQRPATSTGTAGRAASPASRPSVQPPARPVAPPARTPVNPRPNNPVNQHPAAPANRTPAPRQPAPRNPQTVPAGEAVEGTVLASAPASVKRQVDPRTDSHAVIGEFDVKSMSKGTIGRDPSCAIRVVDVLVSRIHCSVEATADGLLLTDLSSSNGTYVNGRRVGKLWLQDGDIVTVGNTDLEYQSGVLRKREMAIGSQAVIAEGIGLTVDKGKRLLDNIDAVFTRGTLTAVIGPSGAGKSTFTSIVAGLNSPTEGHVIFDGYDVHQNLDLMRSRIGFVPQDDVVHRDLTVDAALGYAAKLRLPNASHAERAEHINKVLDELELTDRRKNRISKLSGGQRKRVSTAIELLTEPELLILDEPTSGLDPALDRTVMTMLRQLADGNRIVIVVTHSLTYIDKVCDNVLMLAPGGHSAFFGTVQELDRTFNEDDGTKDWAKIFSDATEHPHKVYSPTDPHERLEKAKRVIEPRSGHEKPAKKHRLKQTVTLVVRQFHLVACDPGLLIFLLLLPLLLGLLSLVVPGSHGFGMPDPQDQPTEPSQLLSLVILGACFMGSAMTVRDIVSERAIYDRERAVGLSPTSYTVSKLLVSGIETLLQASILVGAVIVGKPHPESGVLTDSGIPELLLAVWLTAWASAVLGSIGSSLVRSGEQTMPLLVILVMAQLVFSGGMIPVTDRDGLEQASMVFPGRWGYSAAASDIGLNDLITLPTFTKDDLWDQTKDQFWFDIGMLGIMIVVFSIVLRVCVSNAAGRLRKR